MDLFWQVLINGTIEGSFYSLSALGFTLIVRTNRFIYLAHAAVVLIGVYILYTLFKLAEVNFYLASVLTIVVAGLVGFFFYWVLYRPLQKRKASPGVLLLISISLVLFASIYTLK